MSEKQYEAVLARAASWVEIGLDELTDLPKGKSVEDAMKDLVERLTSGAAQDVLTNWLAAHLAFSPGEPRPIRARARVPAAVPSLAATLGLL
jgi:hypothetical protein